LAPDDVTMPAEVEGAALEASIGGLQRVAQVPGEHLDQEGAEIMVAFSKVLTIIVES